MSHDKIMCLQECVNGLLNVISDRSFPADIKNFKVKYHLDVGILVKVPWIGLPNIPIFDDWLVAGTGVEWLVQVIDAIEQPNSEYTYVVTFLLKEEI